MNNMITRNHRQRPTARRKQAGYSLIEMGVVLLIVAGLATVVLSVASSTIETNRMNTALQDVTQIAQKAQIWRGSKKDYTGIDIAAIKGLLPKHIRGPAEDGVGANPWGGNYTITTSSPGRRFTIEVTGMEETTATALGNQFEASTAVAPVASSGDDSTLTLVFQG